MSGLRERSLVITGSTSDDDKTDGIVEGDVSADCSDTFALNVGPVKRKRCDTPDTELEGISDTEQGGSPETPLKKRAKAEAVDTKIVPQGETYDNNWSLLLQLNSINGGLVDEELSMILCRCSSCNKIFTKHVFFTYHSHTCPSL